MFIYRRVNEMASSRNEVFCTFQYNASSPSLAHRTPSTSGIVPFSNVDLVVNAHLSAQGGYSNMAKEMSEEVEEEEESRVRDCKRWLVSGSNPPKTWQWGIRYK